MVRPFYGSVFLRKENTTQKVSHCTLNQSILKDPILVAEIEQAIKEYFDFNDTAGISPVTLWAAHKVTEAKLYRWQLN